MNDNQQPDNPPETLSAPAPPPARPNPYVGPRPFQTGEQLYGRDREVTRLLNLLIAERIVLLHSPSGAGKTSLIQAALLPRLEAEEFTVLPVMRVNLISDLEPANPYIFSALLALEESLPSEQQIPADQLAQMTLPAYLEHRFGDIPPDPQSGLVFVFDQLEDILMGDPRNDATRLEFFTQVGNVLRVRSNWALFAIREDYMAGLTPYLRAIPTRLDTTFRLNFLDIKDAYLATQQPARTVGVEFTDAAATRLIDDLRRLRVSRVDGTIEYHSGPFIEPVQLQVVCYRLWENLPSDDWEIDEADVIALGDVNLALSCYYAECVASIATKTGVRERTIRDWFDRYLIIPPGVRGQVLRESGKSQKLSNNAIELLIDAHLVRADKRRGATWFELAHDRLIEPIQANNRTWFEQNLAVLQRQAALWESQGRPGGLLLLGEALQHAEQWAEEHPDELSLIDQEFLSVCRQAERTERRQRFLIMALRISTVIMFLAFGLSYVFFWQSVSQTRIIDQQRRTAERAKETAEAAEGAMVALQLTVEALNNNSGMAAAAYIAGQAQNYIAGEDEQPTTTAQVAQVAETLTVLSIQKTEVAVEQKSVLRSRPAAQTAYRKATSTMAVEATRTARVTPSPTRTRTSTPVPAPILIPIEPYPVAPPSPVPSPFPILPPYPVLDTPTPSPRIVTPTPRAPLATPVVPDYPDPESPPDAESPPDPEFDTDS